MEDTAEKMVVEEGEGTNKRDFLKVLGAGLGFAGITSALGGQALAQGDKKGKYLKSCTFRV